MGFEDKLKDIEAELEGLNDEEKQKKINEILNSLSNEELEELKKQQCIFCSIASGSMKSFNIYEDSLVKAVLDIKPANKGHVILFPKDHYTIMSLIDDNLIGHIFRVANMLSKAVFNGVNANGTNIFIANGRAAGQVMQHFLVHIIPRFENDKVTMPWNAKEFSENELNDTSIAIKSKIIKKEERKEDVVVEQVSDRKRRLP